MKEFFTHLDTELNLLWNQFSPQHNNVITDPLPFAVTLKLVTSKFTSKCLVTFPQYLIQLSILVQMSSFLLWDWSWMKNINCCSKTNIGIKFMCSYTCNSLSLHMTSIFIYREFTNQYITDLSFYLFLTSIILQPNLYLQRELL